MTTARQILDSIPARFRPEKAKDLNFVVHFALTGDEELACTVKISNGQCAIYEGLVNTPHCVVKARSNHYIDLELGRLNPQMALLTGKVKVSSMATMMQFVKCFRRFSLEASLPPSATIMRPQRQGPLADVRILDLSRLLPGPMATLLMAQMGADVIKIEDPSSPDPVRGFPPFVDGQSAFYLHLNRTKRSVGLDLNQAEGRELFLHMVKQSDVVVEQFRPGVMEALGLGYQVLKTANPRIILCSITGYGQTGPMAHFPGHDLNYMAYTGLLDSMRTNEGRPTLPAFQAADVAGGSHMAVSAILAALHQRHGTGLGQHLDVAMTDSLFHLNALRIAEERATGQFNRDLAGSLASYNVYACADGQHVALGALEPKFWERFCALVDRPDWATRILDPNRETLKAEVAALFAQQPRQHWLDLLEQQEVCLAPVLTPLEGLAHSHIGARVHNDTWPVFSPSNPWPAPTLGADTAAVLNELNLPNLNLTLLRQRGVVQ